MVSFSSSVRSTLLRMCMEAPESTINYSLSSAEILDREVAPDPNFGVKKVSMFSCCLSYIFFAILRPAWISLFVHKGIGSAAVSRTTFNNSQ